MWQVSVIGFTVEELKLAFDHGSKPRKVLVNHLIRDSIGCVPRGKKIDIIPIEICYTKQTIRALGKTGESFMLVLLPIHAVQVLASLLSSCTNGLNAKMLRSHGSQSTKWQISSSC